MSNSQETAAKAVNILPAHAQQKPTLMARFQDPTRWKKSLTEVGAWFLFGWLLTTMLSMYAPGYPILVGTNSISKGIYWLDRTAFAYSLDNYVSFPFKPAQPWLKERYGDDRVFTKLVKGVAGDTVYADANYRLKVCHSTAYTGGQPRCEDVGMTQLVDSLGRKLTPWVPANHQYTLREGELWVFAPNPKSLDSRYYGPILASAVTGVATPVFLWE